jgi:5-methylcytosine-specific restriction enzyme A
MMHHSIERVLKEYKAAKLEKFAGHALAQIITRSLPEFITGFIKGPTRYKVEGSAGKGNWAGCPWISVFDISITESAQSGYYPVYLFREDMTGAYLSLNQGVTDIRETHKENPKKVLQIRAADYRAQIGPLPAKFPEIEIDLRSGSSNLASFYEPGNICARFYASDALPTEDELIADLREILGVYQSLVDSDMTMGEEEEVPAGCGIEDLRKFRQHKRLERNRKLADSAKKYHGYNCQACGFNFQAKYGMIGNGFIEAHHLRSLSKLKGTVVELDPRTDFVVLCPNCHRMIHRADDPGDLGNFKKLLNI